MKSRELDVVLIKALRLLSEKCSRLRSSCYWAGASAIALEELHHRQSFDLDFHTRKALIDVRPILAEIEQAFPHRFEVISLPDQYGSGFKGILVLSDQEKVTIEVLSNFQDVPDSDLTDSTTVPGVKRITRERFLADKIQCICERSEARDLVDFIFLIRSYPELTGLAKELVKNQDAVMLSERLLSWSDSGIRNDLATYPDVVPNDAVQARDLILEWIKSGENR